MDDQPVFIMVSGKSWRRKQAWNTAVRIIILLLLLSCYTYFIHFWSVERAKVKLLARTDNYEREMQQIIVRGKAIDQLYERWEKRGYVLRGDREGR